MNMMGGAILSETAVQPDRQSGQIRQECPICNDRARIRQSRRLTPLVTEYYIQCMNVDCGLTWKSQMEIIYALSPSSVSNPDVMIPPAPAGTPRRTFNNTQRGTCDDADDPRQIPMFNSG